MESTKSTGVQPSIMETGHILKIDGVLGPTITIPHQLNFQVATDVQSWGWDSLQTTDLILQSFIVEVNHICNHSQKQLFITISIFNQWDYSINNETKEVIIVRVFVNEIHFYLFQYYFNKIISKISEQSFDDIGCACAGDSWVSGHTVINHWYRWYLPPHIASKPDYFTHLTLQNVKCNKTLMLAHALCHCCWLIIKHYLK